MAGARKQTMHEVLRAAREAHRPVVMGICNVTPNSFSDGGVFATEADAVAHVEALFRAGADIVDIGGESTRPGAARVSAAEQLARVLPVVKRTAELGCLSIDTTLPEVAAQALEAGAHVINDVSCMVDARLAACIAAYDAGLVLMHNRTSDPQGITPTHVPEDSYRDVVDEVLLEWREAMARSIASGVDASAIWMDPGLGFAKSASHSWRLLRGTATLVRHCGAPVLIGSSRKSFLKPLDTSARPDERDGASIATALFAARAGAAAVRVHDVRGTVQALRAERWLQAEVALA